MLMQLWWAGQRPHAVCSRKSPELGENSWLIQGLQDTKGSSHMIQVTCPSVDSQQVLMSDAALAVSNSQNRFQYSAVPSADSSLPLTLLLSILKGGLEVICTRQPV